MHKMVEMVSEKMNKEDQEKILKIWKKSKGYSPYLIDFVNWYMSKKESWERYTSDSWFYNLTFVRYLEIDQEKEGKNAE